MIRFFKLLRQRITLAMWRRRQWKESRAMIERQAREYEDIDR